MNLIEVKNLFAGYDGQTVLENINFSVPENSFLSIIGPNGAGKSTLLKVLLGLKKITSGEIYFFNKTFSEADPHIIGYVPQIKTMDRNFPAKAVELVISGLNQRWPWVLKGKPRELAEEALELVGAKKLSDKSLAELSGGELQRICIARSIIKKPKIILLDEPAAGIDAVGESDLYKLLEDYQEKSRATILMITHDWHIANHHSDFVLLLNKIQIGYGTPTETLSEENLRRAFGHIGHDHSIKSGRLYV